MQHASRDIRHQAIRHALKIAYPKTRFSITGHRGTAYGWSTIAWTDGPAEQHVRGIVTRFFGSQFNGMTDGYDSTGNTFVWNGERYSAGGSGFHTERHISPAFARRLLEAVIARYGDFNTPTLVEITDWKGRPDWKLEPTESSPLGNWDGGLYWSHMGIMRRAAEDRTTLAR